MFPRYVPAGVPSSKPVVEIEENMDDRIDTVHEANSGPEGVVTGVVRQHQHRGMVVDMQERHLSTTVTKDHEDCVEQLDYLRLPVENHERLQSLYGSVGVDVHIHCSHDVYETRRCIHTDHTADHVVDDQ